jgi:hypothetical protein
MTGVVSHCAMDAKAKVARAANVAKEASSGPMNQAPTGWHQQLLGYTAASGSAPLQLAPGAATHGSPQTIAATLVRCSGKVAILPSYQYDCKHGGFNWHTKVRDYLISQPLYHTARGRVEGWFGHLARALHALQPSRDFIRPSGNNELCVLGITHTLLASIDNAGPREGFEVWQRLLKGIRTILWRDPLA